MRVQSFAGEMVKVVFKHPRLIFLIYTAVYQIISFKKNLIKPGKPGNGRGCVAPAGGAEWGRDEAGDTGSQGTPHPASNLALGTGFST